MLMILKPPIIFGRASNTNNNSNHFLGVICASCSSMSLGMIYVILRKIKSNAAITVHY